MGQISRTGRGDRPGAGASPGASAARASSVAGRGAVTRRAGGTGPTRSGADGSAGDRGPDDRGRRVEDHEGRRQAVPRRRGEPLPGGAGGRVVTSETASDQRSAAPTATAQRCTRRAHPRRAKRGRLTDHAGVAKAQTSVRNCATGTARCPRHPAPRGRAHGRSCRPSRAGLTGTATGAAESSSRCQGVVGEGRGVLVLRGRQDVLGGRDRAGSAATDQALGVGSANAERRIDRLSAVTRPGPRTGS